jgi:hypothetical protein
MLRRHSGPDHLQQVELGGNLEKREAFSGDRCIFRTSPLTTLTFSRPGGVPANFTLPTSAISALRVVSDTVCL